jgi:hypothetical protein
MEDDSVFEEEGEERDSFVQPARGLRSFALVSWLFCRTWKLSLHHHGISCYIIMQCCGSGMVIPDPNFFHPGLGSISKSLNILTLKIVLSSLKFDPGCSSRIWIDIFFTHPGSRIQESKKHRIPDPDPQHCPHVFDFFFCHLG